MSVESSDLRRRVRKLETRDGITLDELRRFVDACEGIPGHIRIQTPGGFGGQWHPLYRLGVVEERPE